VLSSWGLQDKQNGLPHMEKSADKWGQDGRGGEWQEKWWGALRRAGQGREWADKWSKIDASTPLDEGHAHVWHERSEPPSPFSSPPPLFLPFPPFLLPPLFSPLCSPPRNPHFALSFAVQLCCPF